MENAGGNQQIASKITDSTVLLQIQVFHLLINDFCQAKSFINFLKYKICVCLKSETHNISVHQYNVKLY